MEASIRPSPSGRHQLEASMSSLFTCFKLSVKHACLASTLATAAVLFILLALFGPGFVQFALDKGVKTAIVWSPASPELTDIRYRGVCDPNDPRSIYSDVSLWLYNITNVDAMRQGVKPALALVGPYSYIKVTCKLDAWWDADGHVTAKEYVHYTYPVDGRPSGDADLQANITTLNLALGSVIETIHGIVGPNSAVWLDLLVTVLAGWKDDRVNGMFVRRTAEELLWGYEDPLLTRLKGFLPAGTIPRTRVQLVANATSPDDVRLGPVNMYDTGARNISRVWTILQEHDLTQLTGWPGGAACAETVQGTDGNQYKPGLKLHDRLLLWMGALFRSTELVTLGQQLFWGIKLFRFVPDAALYALDPCKQQYIKGLLNITAPTAVGPGGNGSAAFGAPILVSVPHFCGADSSLRHGVTGLPSCDNVLQHIVEIDVEPITGISMRSHQNIMVSSQVTEAAREHLEPHLNTSTVIPLYYSDEHIQATEQMARQFVTYVYGAKRLKAMLHLWPLLLATACASACACVLVHASLVHLEQVLRSEQEDQEAGRRARQMIIERVHAASIASAAPSEASVHTQAHATAPATAASGGGSPAESRPPIDITEMIRTSPGGTVVSRPVTDLDGDMLTEPLLAATSDRRD